MCGSFGGQKRCVGVLVGIHNGMKQFGRPRLRCEDNIKMYLQEVGWGGMD